MWDFSILEHMQRPLVLLVAALLALAASGCIKRGGDEAPYEPTYTSNPVFSMRVDAVTLHGDVEPGRAQTWHFRAVNYGEPGGNTFEYRTGCGDAPWEAEVTGPTGPVAWRERPVTCQGFETAAFRGGDTLDHAWTWDGRVHGDGGASAAPPGIYNLRIVFEAMHAGTHPSDANGVTTFRVG